MPEEERFEVNAAQCLECNDIIESRHRHDWVQCSCEDIFVDGGQAYRRMGWMPGARWTDITTKAELAEARSAK